MVPSVGCIILAAGASRRMGEPKQLLMYEGKSLLRRATETALQSACRPVVVVLGAHSDRLRDEVSDLPVVVVENPGWSEGMGASIRAGVAALQSAAEEVEAAVLMFCDQPLITPRIVDELTAVYGKTCPLAVASEYGGTCGVPALFSRRLFSELNSLEGAEGAKQIIKRHRGRVLCIAVPEGVMDVDTPADYERLEKLIANKG